MAGSDKSIHSFDTGTIDASTLFPIAYILNAVYATGKISASELGIGLGTNIDFNRLLTGDKTIFGAINELARVSMGAVLTTTLLAGSTSVTFTNAGIKDDSLLDIYTSDMSVNPVGVNQTTGSVTYTFESQSTDIIVALVIRGYSFGGGGGIEYLYEDADLIANYYISESNGTAVAYSGWSCTDFIEVTGGETLAYAVKDINQYNAWYDSNKTYIQKFALDSAGYGHVTVPAGASYMRMSNETADMQKSRLWRET